MIDRSEAVNLARNFRRGDALVLTDKGIECLIKAVLDMDRELSAQPEAREKIPAELFDGVGVYVELGSESSIRPMDVASVLDAAVRLIRKRLRGEALPQNGSER